MGRRGLRVADLLDLKLLRTHIENACREKNLIAHALFNSEPLDPDKMYAEYAEASARIAPFVCDTALLLNRAIANGESVVFEGAQGTMLDIDHGTYPFVTSSSATSGGAVIGTGVAPTAIDTVIGVTKAYCTRVGEGPFPSELNDATGEMLRARGKEFGLNMGRSPRSNSRLLKQALASRRSSRSTNAHPSHSESRYGLPRRSADCGRGRMVGTPAITIGTQERPATTDFGTPCSYPVPQLLSPGPSDYVGGLEW